MQTITASPVPVPVPRGGCYVRTCATKSFLFDTFGILSVSKIHAVSIPSKICEARLINIVVKLKA